MKQKFSRLSFVYICKDMPPEMKYFPSDFYGIIDGTYSQIYGGKDISEYAIYVIKNNKVVDHISWYTEDQITLLNEQDKLLAEEMIERYNFNN
jgi:hypothetical protein